jgi:hypothetical protein
MGSDLRRRSASPRRGNWLRRRVGWLTVAVVLGAAGSLPAEAWAGADGLTSAQQSATTTTVSCNPSIVVGFGLTTCTATVTGTGGASGPTGTVSFRDGGCASTVCGPGAFSGYFFNNPCTLNAGSCQVTLSALCSPRQGVPPGNACVWTGQEYIDATYAGDTTNASSSGTTKLTGVDVDCFGFPCSGS